MVEVNLRVTVVWVVVTVRVFPGLVPARLTGELLYAYIKINFNLIKLYLT